MVKLLNRSWIYVVAMIVLFIALLVALVSPIAAPSQLVVAFDSAGGTPVSMVSLPSRGRLATIPSTSKEGYSFDHWLKGTEEVTLETIFTENTTLRAKFDEIIYTITYDTNGGTLIESEELGYGAKLRLPIPVKDDAVFVGWFKDEALTDPASTDSFEVMRDHTFYAKWSELGEDLFTVSFFSEGLGLIESMLIAPNGSVTLITPPTREGYRFLNWVNGINFQPVTGTSISITQDMVFFAQWEIIAGLVTITFDTQGGSAVPSMQLPLGSTWQDPEQIPVLAEGYQFLSWITNCNFDGFEVSCTTLDETYVVEGNMTVLAKYDYMIPLSSMRFETQSRDGRIIGYRLSSIDFYTEEVIPTVILPARFSGLPIISIGEDAFEGVQFVDRVIIPENIEEIYSYAFANSSIKEVFLPNSLKVLRNEVFYGSDLETVHLGEQSQLQEIHNAVFRDSQITTFAAPRTLDYIGSYAFQNTPLTAISFPTASQLNYIGQEAFKETSLTSVVLPEGLRSLGYEAFYDAEDLTSIYLPSSLTFLGSRAFIGTALTTVQYGLNAQLKFLGENVFGEKANDDLVPLVANSTADQIIIGPILVGYQGPVGSTTSLVVPEGVTAISNRINFNADPLEFSTLTLPSTLNFIGEYAFENLILGSTLTIPSLYQIENGAFYNSNIDGNLFIQGFDRMDYSVFSNSTIDHVHFTSTPKAATSRMDDRIFSDSNIQTITMAEGYIELPYGFTQSSNILSMYLPDSINEIETFAIGSSTLVELVFAGTSPLLDVSSNAISSTAFSSPWYIQSLPYVVMKNNLYRIDVSNLTPPYAINIPDGVTVINSYAGAGITQFESINFNDVEYIMNSAFYQWNRNPSFVTPPTFANLQYLGSSFSNNINSLLSSQQITFGANNNFDIDMYLEYDFSNYNYGDPFGYDNEGFKIVGNILIDYDQASDLTPNDVTIPSTIEIIHSNAFSSVVFPGSLTLSPNTKVLAYNAFYEARFAQPLVLPQGLQHIGSNAFYYSNLTAIQIPSSIRYIGNSAFETDSLQSIELDDPTSAFIESNAFGYMAESISDLSPRLRQYLQGQFLIIEGILFRYFGYQKNVVVPEGVTNILESSFDLRDRTIESITLASTVKYVSNYAFSGMRNLTSVDFSPVVSLNYIGNEIFAHTRIAHVIILAPIAKINSGAFEYMPLLETLDFGTNVMPYLELSINVDIVD